MASGKAETGPIQLAIVRGWWPPAGVKVLKLGPHPNVVDGESVEDVEPYEAGESHGKLWPGAVVEVARDMGRGMVKAGIAEVGDLI